MQQRQVVPPSAEELQHYSLGKCEALRAAEIEAFLSNGPDCSSILDSAPEDVVVRHLRGAGELPKLDAAATLPRLAVAASGMEPVSDAALGADADCLRDHPRYRLIRKLGQGGMGTVYLAEHRLMRRLVAVKLIRAGYLSNPQLIERFHQEVQASARLSHPHIVTAHDADEADGTHFLVMEYVEGESLDRRLARQGPLPVHEACAFVRQAALGLEFAHTKGLVHRDVKPHNLMCTPDGTVKVLDFGLARLFHETARPEGPLTSEGVVMGTADYMAPEQARDSHHADIRADVYSLGCTLYHLLSGHVPFPHGTAIDKIVKHSTSQPEPINRSRGDLPGGLIRVIDRMMARKLEDRYQTPREAAESLELFIQPDTLPPRRRRWPWLLAGAVAALLIAIAIIRHRSAGTKPSTNDVATDALDVKAKFVPKPELSPTFTNQTGMEFVLVSKGKYWMGGIDGKPGGKEIQVPFDFYLGKFEVTQDEWVKVRGGSALTEDQKRFPVGDVSWNEAQVFLRRLNAMEKEKGWEYRLPTNAEWEYACRGGPMTNPSESAFDFYFLEPSSEMWPGQAVFGREKGLSGRAQVGSGKPNRLGLYDMHGNMWELCEDGFGTVHRVVRGGGWDCGPRECRAAGFFDKKGNQFGTEQYFSWPSLGLRVARVPSGEKVR